MTRLPLPDEIKEILCKHCNTLYLNTANNYYTKKGKLALDICKSCKRDKSKTYAIKNPRDRREYNKKYALEHPKDRSEYRKAYYLKKKNALNAKIK